MFYTYLIVKLFRALLLPISAPPPLPMQAQAMHPQLLEQCLSFYSTTAQWLVQLVTPSHVTSGDPLESIVTPCHVTSGDPLESIVTPSHVTSGDPLESIFTPSHVTSGDPLESIFPLPDKVRTNF